MLGNPELASYLRIEERKLDAGGRNYSKRQPFCSTRTPAEFGSSRQVISRAEVRRMGRIGSGPSRER
jgi:hypothetical protein